MTKPKIKLLTDDLLAAAVDAGVRYMEVIIDTVSGIAATGIPAELVELLSINSIDVSINLSDGEGANTSVQLRSSKTESKTWTGMSFHGNKGHCDRAAVVEAIRKTVFADREYGHHFGWLVSDLKEAIRLLGEEP